MLLPGVGHAAKALANLRESGLAELIPNLRRPVLGICVGHQVLFEAGDEHGVITAGVGVLPGRVERLTAARLPHMGWNVVEAPAESKLFEGVGGERFYFVHSYGVHAGGFPDDARVTWVEHGGDRVVAAVEHGPLSATQFHPEKSGAAGARLLRNWVASLA